MVQRVRSTPSAESLFGSVLRQRRAKHQISQEELAHRADLHRTYVSQIERGLKAPSLRVILSLAHSMGEAAHEMVREVETNLRPSTGNRRAD